MNSLKTIISIFIVLITISNVFGQQFIELDSIAGSHKFPILKYPEKPVVEEKVNTIMQLLYQELYPEVFGGEPIEEIFESTDETDYSFQVHSWKQFSLHPNVFDIRLMGSEDGESYERTETFDVRTGTHFKLWSLYTKEGEEYVDRKIKDKINELAKKEKVFPGTEKIGLNYQFAEKHLAFLINKIEDDKLFISYEELEPYLTPYGQNLLLESSTILYNPDMRMKLLKGEGGYGNSKNVKYSIFISNIDDTKASIYRWSKDNVDKATLYTIATIKDGALQADDYIFDSLTGDKQHLMHSLQLEKTENAEWKGMMQLGGSPVYPMIFTEN